MGQARLPTLSTLTNDEIWAVAYANRGLCTRVMIGYLDRGLDREDLMQEGMFGLYRAVQLFDPDRDIKFSTYACHWIAQAMERATTYTGAVIRVPRHATMSARKIARAAALHEIDPDRSDVAVKMKPKRRAMARQALAARRMLSLDWEYDFGGEHTESGRHSSHRNEAVAPELNDAIDAEQLDAVLVALDSLDDRSRTIVRGHYLEGRTLNDLGLELHTSRQRCKQIEDKALATIREMVPAWTG